MKTKLFLIFLCFTVLLELSAQTVIPLNLELARTEEERNWGLMGRKELGPNQGMLFYHPAGLIWMFNMYIDLSVAFLDKNGKILQICDLKAYPEMMDPLIPIHTVTDIKKYQRRKPILEFYMRKAIRIPDKAQFALEMNDGWFKDNHVVPGDQVIWSENPISGSIVKQPG